MRAVARAPSIAITLCPLSRSNRPNGPEWGPQAKNCRGSISRPAPGRQVSLSDELQDHRHRRCRVRIHRQVSALNGAHLHRRSHADHLLDIAVWDDLVVAAGEVEHGRAEAAYGLAGGDGEDGPHAPPPPWPRPAPRSPPWHLG